MSTSTHDLFFAAIKKILAPELRKMGFTGSGNHYRRQQNDAINTIHIQSNRLGGSACVNLGLHFTCLPRGWQNDFPPLSEWREIDCEFRTRLTPSGVGDQWWTYQATELENSATVYLISDLFISQGEALFNKTSSSELFAKFCSVDWLASRSNTPSVAFPWTSTDIRTALALARIHDASRGS